MIVQYDAVTCVSRRDVHLARLSIDYLLRNSRARTIFVITPQRAFRYLRSSDSRVVLVDEDSVIPNVTFSKIKEFLRTLTPPNILWGWYYQQFLKMGLCHYEGILDNYLIWDSDTVLLHPLEFFDADGNIVFTKATEFHKPYFDTYSKLLSENRNCDFSFISQHMMIQVRLMKELIDRIQKSSLLTGEWVWTILKTIKNRNDYGQWADLRVGRCPEFSEYETYGNFIYNNHPQTATFENKDWYRLHVSIGRFPTTTDLIDFSKKHKFVAFEGIYPYTKIERLYYFFIRPLLVFLGGQKIKQFIGRYRN